MNKPLTSVPSRLLRVTLGLIALIVSLSAQARTCPSWPTAERFVINGDEVTDKRTSLVWKRCSEGQALSGDSCTGSASLHTHEAALALAQSQNTDGSPIGWRLPNVKELSSLTDKGCSNPAIDSNAFPNTPSQPYWSSTPNASNSREAWYVGFGSSKSSPIERGINDGVLVRLVRSSQ